MHSALSNMPTPSKNHSTCAWCTRSFGTIVELIDHVDTAHISQPANSGARRAA